jgi:2,6-dihydroxypseudooxynicotine hydrolase
VLIPYEGKHLAGNLRKPAGAVKPPVVVMCMGLDSTKEEMDSNESVFLARGMATLAFDGPGQGEGEYDFAIRGDYEVAVKAVLDYVGNRGDVDGARIGLWGVSLGGYYAPRAAAFDKRIKACIALSGPFEWVEYYDRLPELTRNTFRVRSRSRTEAEARERAATLTLKNVAKNITCPLFVVAGKQDGIVPWQEGERLAAAASGPVVRCFLDDGNHVANNRAYRYRSQSADWMSQCLGVPKQ